MGATFQHEAATSLLAGDYRDSTFRGSFDISVDGSRFLLQNDPIINQRREVTLLVAVDNCFEELKRLAPPDPQ